MLTETIKDVSCVRDDEGCLRVDILLGQGAFGKVMRAEAMGILEPDVSTTVAVKTVKGAHTCTRFNFIEKND